MIDYESAFNAYKYWEKLITLSFNAIEKESKEIIPVGSIRRKKNLIGDIDILVKSEANIYDIYKIVNFLKLYSSHIKSCKVIRDKWLRILTKDFQVKKIDIFFVNNKNYVTSKIFFTGSSNFNCMIKEVCKSKNIDFNYNRFVEGVNLNNEHDFFNYLGIDYVDPEKR